MILHTGAHAEGEGSGEDVRMQNKFSNYEVHRSLFITLYY